VVNLSAFTLDHSSTFVDSSGRAGRLLEEAILNHIPDVELAAE
jgi:hypothetical protein